MCCDIELLRNMTTPLLFKQTLYFIYNILEPYCTCPFHISCISVTNYGCNGIVKSKKTGVMAKQVIRYYQQCTFAVEGQTDRWTATTAELSQRCGMPNMNNWHKVCSRLLAVSGRTNAFSLTSKSQHYPS